jgi:hypothetical protein
LGQRVLYDGVLKQQFGIYGLKATILGLKVSDAFELVDRHTGILTLSMIVGGNTDAMFETDVCHRRSYLTLTQNANNQTFRKFGLLYLSYAKNWKSIFSTCPPLE